jgi:(1->4)-alpha-D-glucan 1-alpha-D-glucosylmutase
MVEQGELVRRLAFRVNIEPSYRDAFGHRIEASEDDLRAVLEALGFATQNAACLTDSLAWLESSRTRLIPFVIPVPADHAIWLRLENPDADQLVWRLTAEDGTTREARATVCFGNREAVFALPALSPGYYRLHVETAGKKSEACLIAAPQSCYLPPALTNGSRWFGATAQIYALRSEQDFGIGDFSALAYAAENSARYGASFFGLSPIHALFSADRTKISPYSPSSRLFIDPIYIDPRQVPDFESSPAASILANPDIVGELEQLRAGRLVDYPAAWVLKRKLLDLLWLTFRSQQDWKSKLATLAEFEDFRSEGGEELELHATFESLANHCSEAGFQSRSEWPAEYREPTTAAVHNYRRERAEDIEFHIWLQWVADRQLRVAQERALAAGMEIGLYRDLAVGPEKFGSETWAHSSDFAMQLSIGAPPDPFAPLGQNWHLSPFNPLTLEARGLSPFRDLVAANMRHAGAIRIDHAFQLQRLFVIPETAPNAAGVYLDYPFDAMLAVLRLESHRARTIVIGEDLGTAPEGFSTTVMRNNILSTRLLWFERASDGTIKLPDTYPRLGFAAVTTHDLPTFVGWWHGRDIEHREAFGIYDREQAERQRLERTKDKAQLCRALADQGLLSFCEDQVFEDPVFENQTPPFDAVLRYLARCRSALAAISFEDISSEIDQANLPGKNFGYPNWRLKLSQDLDTILKPDGPFAKSAGALASEGRRIQ